MTIEFNYTHTFLASLFIAFCLPSFPPSVQVPRPSSLRSGVPAIALAPSSVARSEATRWLCERRAGKLVKRLELRLS